MKMRLILTGAALLAAGCAHKKTVEVDPGPSEAELNRTIVRLAQDQNARSAIVAERAIYDHHFDAGAATLNYLGQRQVQTLADAYKATPTRIHISQGDATDDLYQLRVQSVRDEFAKAGMASEGLSFDDGNPDGPGMSSLRVWSALTAAQNQRTGSDANSKPLGSSSGTTSNMSGRDSNSGSR